MPALAHAAEDIWHCNALGVYSGYEQASSGGPGGPPPSGEPADPPSGPPADPPGGPPADPPPGGGVRARPTLAVDPSATHTGEDAPAPGASPSA